MKIKSDVADLLKPGLMALFSLSYYIPTSKRIRRLLKKHPKASSDLWIDAFNSGFDHGMKDSLREEDDEKD